MPQALAHDVNPATDRCVRCGRNRFNRDQQPHCMTTGDYVQKWQEEDEVRREAASASPAPTPDERDERLTSHALDVMAREGKVSAEPAPTPAGSHEHFWHTVVRNRMWITECRICGMKADQGHLKLLDNILIQNRL